MTAPVSASVVTPRFAAMLGSEVLRIAPLSNIMKNEAATISAMRRVEEGVEGIGEVNAQEGWRRTAILAEAAEPRDKRVS
jgi:hypothetical protein